jgi:ribonuclease-3
VTPSEPTLDALATRIGHDFADPALLRRSLAHRSWCAEHDGEESNERLEFLGDAVLGWVVADLAYRRFTDVPEGRLTDLRKAVVNTIALAAVAEELGLGPHVLLGKGEAAAGGAEKPSILADVFEAVLGAVYLDGGTDAAYSFVARSVGPRMVSSIDRLGELDHKTALQERCAAAGHGSPVYEISAVGPDHAKVFTARVLVDGRPIGEGQGRSKKSAEQAAAREAYDALA